VRGTLGGGAQVVTVLLAVFSFGGFFIVPLYALIQSRSEPSHRSTALASLPATIF
jgi:hypothetical protein